MDDDGRLMDDTGNPSDDVVEDVHSPVSTATTPVFSRTRTAQPAWSSSVSTCETLLLILLPILTSGVALVVSARAVTGAGIQSTSTPTPTSPTSTLEVPSDAALVYMSRGTTDRLICPAEADPPLTLIVWTKNGRVIDASVEGARLLMFPNYNGGDRRHGRVAEPRLSISKHDNHLVISNVTMNDTGLYTCTAYSPLDNDQPIHRIMIIVKGLLSFTSSALYLQASANFIDLS